MSINQAIGNAFSGLAAASRAAEIVSRNVANATTEGYSATELTRSQQLVGGEGAGVKVLGVERAGNPLVTADRRRIEAGAGRAETEAQVMRDLSDLLTDPDGGDSLSSRFAALENALRGLADTPESTAMQSTVVAAGRALATRFNTLSTQAARMIGDLNDDVKRQVQTVNTALKKIAQLNTSITAGKATGKDTTALEDERDRQIEVVNGIVPIRTKDRDSNGMMVSTANGILLVEGGAREIEWDPATQTLSVMGSEISAKPPSGGLQGGTLEATITALTETVPAFMAQVDALAADIVKRFQNLSGYETDVATVPALTGLFTDNGQRFDETTPGAEVGLAGRMRLHAAVDPTVGGSPSALVTGSLPAVGDPLTGAGQTPLPSPATPETFPTALMSAMRAVSTSGVPPISGAFNATDLAIQLVSIREVNANDREAEASFQRGATQTMREREDSFSAVDTDAQMQALLRLEQTYAANARILEVTSGLINRLLEI